jgi:hypothetical protein
VPALFLLLALALSGAASSAARFVSVLGAWRRAARKLKLFSRAQTNYCEKIKNYFHALKLFTEKIKHYFYALKLITAAPNLSGSKSGSECYIKVSACLKSGFKVLMVRIRCGEY